MKFDRVGKGVNKTIVKFAKSKATIHYSRERTSENERFIIHCAREIDWENVSME